MPSTKKGHRKVEPMTPYHFRKWIREYTGSLRGGTVKACRDGGVSQSNFYRFTKQDSFKRSSMFGIFPMMRMLKRLGCSVRILIHVTHPVETKGRSIYVD
jgi:hypothetical protein